MQRFTSVLRSLLYLGVLASLCLVTDASADDAVSPTEIEKYAEASYQARPAALALARKSLELKRKQRSKAKDAHRKSVEALEKRVSELEDPYHPYFGDHQYDPGTIGHVKCQAEVIQVISDKEALVGLISLQFRGGGGSSAIEAGSAEADLARQQVAVSTLYYLENYPTKGLIDGRAHDLDGVFYMGTRQYEPVAGGSRTVPMLKPVDLSEHQDMFTRKRDRRTWTLEGGAKADAIFVRFDRGKVYLAHDDGKVAGVLLSKFSEADRKLVRELIKPHPAEKRR